MDAVNRGIVHTTIAVLQRTSGRDKVARIIQYGGLFVAWLIEKYQLPRPLVTRLLRRYFMVDLSLGDNIRKMSSSAGSARKVFRLFGFIEQLRSAATALSLIDPLKKCLIFAAKLSSALYLFADNLVWAESVNVIRINAEKCKKFENRFWLAQLTLNCLRDIYEWCLLVKNEYERTGTERTREVIPLDAKPLYSRLVSICSQHQDLTMDSVTNLLDLFIPLGRLGHIRLPEHIIGLVGLITSILRLVTIISPAYKLPHS